MTTATRPQHGERRCYLRGCRRDECTTANYRYMSQLRLDIARGQRRRIKATQTIAHVERLLANGWTQAQITRRTGVGHRTIGMLLAGRDTVAKATALAVLSIPIGPPPRDSRDVDATGTTRRVRALAAIGYPIAHLAARFGMHETALGHIARGDLKQVRATTAQTIAREYRHLSRNPGSSNRARFKAARDGWHGPLAWDDIDDPAAEPEVDDKPHGQQRRRGDADPARIDLLTREGKSSAEIARIVGVHQRTVIRVRSQLRNEQKEAA